MTKIYKTALVIGLGFIVLSVAFVLDIKGYIWHNDIPASLYRIKGLDVSHHQNEIRWEEVGQQGYTFVFMKATECNDFIDTKFKENWVKAKEVGMIRGAYHFFSLTSSGKEQAANFINVVPKEKGTLPPVIDIEIPTDRPKEKVLLELNNLLIELESYYGVGPILYVTYETYYAYVEGNLDQYSLWLRDVYKHPDITIGNEKVQWSFWQYANRGHVKGIDTYVDKNVYRGTKEKFNALISQ